MRLWILQVQYETTQTRPHADPLVCFAGCVSAMHDASRRLQDCLADMYEPDWFGKEEMDALAEVRQEVRVNDHVCKL